MSGVTIKENKIENIAGYADPQQRVQDVLHLPVYSVTTYE
jgi:hypothetical protein